MLGEPNEIKAVATAAEAEVARVECKVAPHRLWYGVAVATVLAFVAYVMW